MLLSLDAVRQNRVCASSEDCPPTRGFGRARKAGPEHHAFQGSFSATSTRVCTGRKGIGSFRSFRHSMRHAGLRRGASSDPAQHISGAGGWRPAFAAAMRHGELTGGRLRTVLACAGRRRRPGPRYRRAFGPACRRWRGRCSVCSMQHRGDGVRFNHDALYIRIFIRTIAPEPAYWLFLLPPRPDEWPPNGGRLWLCQTARLRHSRYPGDAPTRNMRHGLLPTNGRGKAVLIRHTAI